MNIIICVSLSTNECTQGLSRLRIKKNRALHVEHGTSCPLVKKRWSSALYVAHVNGRLVQVYLTEKSTTIMIYNETLKRGTLSPLYTSPFQSNYFSIDIYLT